MPKTWTLRSSLWVPHPPEIVFPFFAEARNLESLTPPWLSFRILTPQPIAMHAGTMIDYRIALHGVPMRWRTHIARFDAPAVFVDEQVRGPYSLWRHTHTFTPQDGGTVLGDEVVMRPKGGPLAPLLFAWFVRGDVERIFRYRMHRMAEQFGGEVATGRLQWVGADAAASAHGDHAKAPSAGAR